MIAPAVLSVDGASRALEGVAYGLGQPALLKVIRVSRVLPDRLAELERSMLEFVTTPYVADAPEADDGPRSLARRLHHWHTALQREADVPVFGTCFVGDLPRDPSDGEVAKMLLAVPHVSRQASEAALRWVVRAVNTLLEPAVSEAQRQQLRAGFAELQRALKPAALVGVNAIHFLAAAHRLGMPVTALAAGVHCIGLGRNARRLNSSVTDETRLIAAGLAQDKFQTACVLGKLGFPVPKHALVRSEEEAVALARSIGYPVVVKPADCDGGRGVFAGLGHEGVVRSSYREASRLSRRILVEKHFEGADFRFTVVHGAVVKVMERRPGGVTGDGQADVSALLARVQASPSHQRALRREGKWRLSLDREAMELLAEQGLDAQSVPAAGRFVRLRRKSNISSGGEHSLVPLEAVHADNADLAIRVARAIGLDLAGIDLILPDVARPWHETGAIVCEVNAKPQIGLRDTPEIYVDILRRLVPGDGTVPVHLRVHADDTAAPAPEAAAGLAARLGCNAFSSARGVWVGGRQSVWRPGDAFLAAQAMLLDDRVESALVFMPAKEVLRRGLPASRLASIRLPAAAGAPQLASLVPMLSAHTTELRIVRAADGGPARSR